MLDSVQIDVMLQFSHSLLCGNYKNTLLRTLLNTLFILGHYFLHWNFYYLFMNNPFVHQFLKKPWMFFLASHG
jgi:hypothetical protein